MLLAVVAKPGLRKFAFVSVDGAGGDISSIEKPGMVIPGLVED